MPNDEEKKLNKEQIEAVHFGEGPLLIIAGAGTGKTTVITERIKYLVSSGKAKTSQILALTFTDKAAREMEERVDIAMPYGYTDMWISTFHSFCDRVLREQAIHIGLDPRYKLMTEAETTQFLIKNLFKFDLKYFRPLGNPTKFISGLLQHFSRLKDEDVSLEQYLKYSQKSSRETGHRSAGKAEKEEVVKTKELALAYQTYEQLKTKQSLMDFGDLIDKTLKLFRTRKNILTQYQQQFKYFLVDEFQDTNYAQYALLKALAPPSKKPNLTVVGDDSQSIYKFRGAAVSNILQFMKEYSQAKQVVLTKNYRSTQTILDSSYKLIKYNDPDTLEVKLGISKNLKAVRKVEEMPIEFLHADRVENEAEITAQKIKELTFKKYKFSEVAILARANNHVEPFVRALARAGIPYQFLGPGQLFRQGEVKDLIAYLKVLYNFEDNVALYRVLSMEYFDINPRDLAAINNYGRKQNLSLFEACEQAEKIFISQKTKEQAGSFVKMIHRHLGLLRKETAGQILYYFLEDSGLLRKMTEYKTPIEEKVAQNIAKFFDRLRSYEIDHEDASVEAVVDWLNLSMELGESPLANNIDWFEENRVNLLTVHSSKGLEFPVVFLVNLVSERFPTRERREQIPIPEKLIKEILPVGDYHEEEERRLFYVGMTRARDRLFFTAADYYGEGKREKKISPFVFEALGEKAIMPLSNLALKSNESPLLVWQRKEEKNLPTIRQPINYLSFSQIEAFNNCPLQYRYRFLQKIPTPPSGALSFGDSIHKTLKEFGEGINLPAHSSLSLRAHPSESKTGRQENNQKLTQKDLLKILENNWSSIGYASKSHEEKAKKQAEKILANFYKDFDPKAKVIALEQPFTFKIGPNLKNKVLPKAGSYLKSKVLPKAGSYLKIVGKIDRIDEKKDGILEIIDYKTGKIMEQKEVDKSLQMTVYALAATDKGIFNKKPEEIILTFYFLGAGEKISTKRTAEQLTQAKKDILEKAKEIMASSFEPKSGNLCKFCEYKLICDAWV